MLNVNNQSQNLFAIDAIQDLDNEAAATFSGGAGPVTLNQTGESTSFPTYLFGSTKVCVQSLDPNNSGEVNISNEFGSEILRTDGGATNCIDRNYVAIPINVTNTRINPAVPVSVFTL